MKRFDCEDIGTLTEYVGCKIEQDYFNGSIHFTQPVMIKRFTDKFPEKRKERKCVAPADYGTVLVDTKSGEGLSKPKHKYFRYIVEKMLHLTRWSCPEIQNTVRDLTRHGINPNEAHIQAMNHVMKYCVDAPNRV